MLVLILKLKLLLNLLLGITDRYILKQTLIATVFGVCVFCMIFLMGTIFKEARPLLVGQNAAPMLMVRFVGSVLPMSLMFVIPCSFLAGILITIGRLSSDNEITSLQMAGRGLYRISVPIFILAGALCIFCSWLNTYAAPTAKSVQKRILFEAVQQDPNRLLDPGVIQHQLKDQIVYLEKREGDMLYGLHIFENNKTLKSSMPVNYVYAKQAQLFFNKEKKELRLNLKDSYILPDDLKKMAIIDEQKPLIFELQSKKMRQYRISSMSNKKIKDALASTDPKVVSNVSEKKRTAMRNELISRFSFSFSCLSFAFIGVPLAMSSKRKETSSGFSISIVIALLYFSFFIVGKDMQDKSGILPPILLWAPNVLAVLLGAYLFRRIQKR